jgi:tetratricopeptide (TPR) repeat protein
MAILTTSWVATGCLTGPRRNPDQADRHLELAEDYFGRWRQNPAMEALRTAAIADAEEAARLDRLNERAQNVLGLLYLMQAMDEQNLLEREQCLEGPAAHEQERVYRDKLARARAYFREAIRLKPNYSEAHNSLAVVELQSKSYDEAIRHAEAAAGDVLYREPHLALGTLGWARYHKGDLPRAEKDLARALFHQPRFCVGRYRLAHVYYAQKRYDRAEAELGRVLEEKCEFPEAYHLLGLCRALRGDRDGALAGFSRCEKLAPQSCFARDCRRDRKLVN